jgi:thiol-disulfide isomerase/thioredoxin
MMQMSYQPSNHQRTSNRLLSRSGSPASNGAAVPVSRTSNNAVAPGCAELEYGEQASLRSRVGFALGDFKRRIVRSRPNVEVIEDVSDFDSILKSTKEQFVAVFFHSPVCKACQAAAPHFYKLSQKYSNVKFLSVPLTPGNKLTLQQDMGVKKFPFGHIYHSQHGLLDELPILRKLIPHFEERLLSHVSAGSSGVALPEDVESMLLEGNVEVAEEECTQ